jgi:predicted deacetylase
MMYNACLLSFEQTRHHKMTAQRPLFLIIVHDVAAPFRQELQVIFDSLHALVETQFSCAVVPRWHGSLLNEQDELLNLIADCDELLLHGWTHLRAHTPGIVSRFTARSDELGGLGVHEIQDRIDNGKSELERLTGRDVRGLLPPAWQFPFPTTTLQGLSYVMRYSRLEFCRPEIKSRKLATWSYDWGWLKQAAWAGHLLGHARSKTCPHAIPCIAIHPIDVSRGWLPRITKLIQKFVDLGCQPTVPQAICTGATNKP